MYCYWGNILKDEVLIWSEIGYSGAAYVKWFQMSNKDAEVLCKPFYDTKSKWL